MNYISYYPSPLGLITLASDGKALTGLWFNGQKYDRANLSAAYEARPLPVFEQTAKWLDLYFRGMRPDFTPPIRLNATPFRTAVWNQLLTIPYGQTVTYGALAASLSAQLSSNTCARAVGSAVGRNPISLIIPCHRVLGAGGRLTGYAGGVDKKLALLRLEGVDSVFFP